MQLVMFLAAHPRTDVGPQIEAAHCNGHQDDVVDECPNEIKLDLAERSI